MIGISEGSDCRVPLQNSLPELQEVIGDEKGDLWKSLLVLSHLDQSSFPVNKGEICLARFWFWLRLQLLPAADVEMGTSEEAAAQN